VNLTLEIASGATLALGADGQINGTGTVVNKGTISTRQANIPFADLGKFLEQVGGTVEVTVAPISVTSGTLTIPKGTTLKLSDQATLTVASGAKVEVKGDGTLDLSALDGTDKVDLKGTIEVAKDGIFCGPVAEAGKTPEIKWAGGSIVFKYGSKGYFGPAPGGDYYIGAADGDGAHYQWDTKKNGTVTLKGEEMELEGDLTSAKWNYIADTATIKGTLTVEKTLTLAASAELVVADGAKVNVAEGGTLDLAALYVADKQDGSAGELNGVVTINGTIEVASGGTLNNPGPSQAQEVVYGTNGSVKLNHGSSVKVYVQNQGLQPYIGPSASGITWTDQAEAQSPSIPIAEQYVTMKNNDETIIHANLTLNGIDYGIGGKTNIDRLATLTVAEGSPDRSAILIDAKGDIQLSGTIEVHGGTTKQSWIEFKASTSKLTLLPGGKLDVNQYGAIYSDSYTTTSRQST
jgi:hypothetical protein